MPEYTDAAVPTAAAPTELKSTDTSNRPVIAPEPEKVETKAEPVAESPKVEAKEPEPEGAPEGGEDAPSADDHAGKKKDRLPRWVQERMERVRRVTEAEARERVLREIAEGKLSAQPPQVPAQEPEAVAKPTKTLADFDFDQEAYTEYKVELAIERREQKARAEAEQRKQAEAAEQFKSRVMGYVGQEGWEDVESSTFNADPKYADLWGLFMGEENDHAVAHHLATNMDEVDRLMSLSPLARVRELAKLADSFGAPSQVEKPVPVVPKKITSAPPPTRTIPSTSNPVVDVTSPDISTAARIKAWKQQQGRKS